MGNVAISTFHHTVKCGWKEGDGEGVSDTTPSLMACLESVKEVKVSRSFGLSDRQHHGKQ